MMDLDRRYLVAGAVLALLLVFAAGMKYATMRQGDQVQPKAVVQSADESKKAPAKTDDNIKVYVTGAVEKPGVYSLVAGARINEAIEMAHPMPSADLKRLNLAMKLNDGQAVYVAADGEVAPESLQIQMSGSTTGTSNGASGGQVNINTASAEELDARLPGVGPAIAQRIVEYRAVHGPFSQPEDLNDVSGIGDRKYSDIKDVITVR